MLSPIQLFTKQVEKNPHQIAVLYKDTSINYEQLDEKSEAFAQALIAKGICKRDLIALYTDRSINMIAAMLGIWKAGAAYLPLDPQYPQKRIDYMLEESYAKLIACDPKYIKRFPSDKPTIDISKNWPESNKEVFCPFDQKNLAYVLYTSGSTNKPKGVCLQQSSVSSFILWALETYSKDDLQTVCAGTSICFDLSIFEIFVPLCSGGSVYLLKSILDLIHEDCFHTPTLINTVPSAIKELLRLQSIPSTIRTVNLAGEALQQKIVDQLYDNPHIKRVYNLYGPSEDTTYSTFYLAKQKENHSYVPIGKSLKGKQAFVLDPYMNLLPKGVKGEIYLAGEGLAQGYLYREDLTEQHFIYHSFNERKPIRLYRSGDLGRMREDGTLEFLGRKDQQVKVRGFRIELGEIEAKLRRHPNIVDAIVSVKAKEKIHHCLYSFLILKDLSLKNEDIKEFLRSFLPPYAIPQHFVILNKFPLTPNGKIDRLALNKQMQTLEQKNTTHPKTSPLSPSEIQLAHIWTKLLKLPLNHINKNHSFFELGGHSLLATQLSARIHKQFTLKIPLRIIFEKPQLEEMAKYIDEYRKNHPINSMKSEKIVFDHIPLSFQQQRLWFLEKILPQSGIYHMPLRFKIEGHLNIEILQSSIKQLIQRHDILKTSFQLDKGQIQQRITSHINLPLRYSDFSKNIQERQVEILTEIEKEESSKPFDLSKAPLMRVHLIYTKKQQHLLFVTLHHIIADGWSLKILFEEWGKLYRKQQLPPVPLQYHEYAIKQQNLSFSKEKKYWDDLLKNAPPFLPFPTDYPRPLQFTYQGASYRCKLFQEIYLPLKALAKKQKTTLFILMLTAFKILLYRYSKQKDLFVGTPIINRKTEEEQQTVGFFSNTLVIRSTCLGSQSFLDYLSHIQRISIEAYEHQNFPFEKIVDHLNVERSLQYHPLFQMLFSLQHEDDATLSLDRVETSYLPLEKRYSKFDLSLFAIEKDQHLELSFEYATDLFSKEGIATIAQSFSSLLKSIIKNPSCKINHLKMISENNLQKQYERTFIEKKELCLHQAFDQTVMQYPDHIALINGKAQLTYQDIDKSANQLANYLLKKGIQPGDFIGLCLERSHKVVISILAILKVGAAYVPLDPESPNKRLHFILQDSKIKFVITQSSYVSRFLSDNFTSIVLDTTEILSEKTTSVCTNLSNEMPAYIIYTSGTTGKPKGVIISHHNAIRLFSSTQNWTNFTCHDTWTLFHSYAFDFSVWEIWGALLYGGKLIIVPYATSRSPKDFFELLIDHRVTVLNQTPTAFYHLLEYIHFDRGWNPRFIIFGGESLNPCKLEKWFKNRHTLETKLINMYGITETTVHVTYGIINAETSVSNIGIPIEDMNIYLLDEHQQMLPPGVPGEIYVTGEGLAKGYLNQVELSKERFIPNPFSKKKNAHMYRSGDLAKYLYDGTLQYLGRIDSQIKIRGHRIEIGEIEFIIKKQKGIINAVVKINQSKELIAYYTGEKQNLKKICKDFLPPYMIPNYFVHMDDIPLTNNGKIDFLSLPAPQPERISSIDQNSSPKTHEEKNISAIWKKVLNINQVNTNEAFFDLGGNSLKMIEVLDLLQKQYPKLTMIDLFKYPTIACLARSLKKTENSKNDFPPPQSKASKRKNHLNIRKAKKLKEVAQ